MALRTLVLVLGFVCRAGVAAGLSLTLEQSRKPSLPAAVRLASGSPCAPEAEHVVSELGIGHGSKAAVPVKFYMYDTGAFNLTATMNCMFTHVKGTLGVDEMDDLVPPETAEHMTDYWLLELMRNHPSRTQDPEKADMFVVGAPLASAFFASTMHGSRRMHGDCDDIRDHAKRVDGVYRELRQSKYWAKNEGRDHFFINTSPWRHFRLSLGGDLFDMMFNEGQVIYATADRKYNNLDLYERATIVPYKAHYLLDKPGQLADGDRREVPITFHGDMGRGSGGRSKIPALTEKVPAASIRDSRTTQGYVPPEELKVTIQDTVMTYLNSSFCLVPSGDTPTTRRLFDALAAGCVPVVLSSFDSLADNLPFKDTVNWAEIAIFAGDFSCIADDEDAMAIWLQNLVEQRTGQDVEEVRQRGMAAFRYLSYHSFDMVDALLRDVQPQLEALK